MFHSFAFWAGIGFGLIAQALLVNLVAIFVAIRGNKKMAVTLLYVATFLVVLGGIVEAIDFFVLSPDTFG